MVRMLHLARLNCLLLAVLSVAMVQRIQSAEAETRTTDKIARLDPALDALLSADEKIEVIGKGFIWCEGPVWVRDGGFLLFSDIPHNAIVRWDSKGGCKTF